MEITRGMTGLIIPVQFNDTTSVIGGGKTGLLFNMSGLTCYYFRSNDTQSRAVTLQTMALGTWASGGFLEVDSVHQPGLYAFGVPNAAVDNSDSSSSVTIVFAGASGAYAPPIRIDLTAVNFQDAIRFGLTALPNANAGASGGLPTRDSNGNIAAAPDWSHITNPTTTVDLSGTTVKNVDNAIAHVTTVDGNVVGSVNSVATTVDAHVSSIANGVIVAATFAANALDSVWDALTANHTIANTFGAVLGSGSASAAAIWNYVIASTLSAGNTLSAIYQKTLASPIQFINPFIAVNKQLGPIVCGDAYTTANNRQIDMPVPGNVPISSCTLKLPNEDGTEQTINGTPVLISSQWYARYELSTAETTPLAISSAGQVVSYGAKAVATADSTVLTVQQGNLVVVRSL